MEVRLRIAKTLPGQDVGCRSKLSEWRARKRSTCWFDACQPGQCSSIFRLRRDSLWETISPLLARARQASESLQGEDEQTGICGASERRACAITAALYVAPHAVGNPDAMEWYVRTLTLSLFCCRRYTDCLG